MGRHYTMLTSGYTSPALLQVCVQYQRLPGSDERHDMLQHDILLSDRQKGKARRYLCVRCNSQSVKVVPTHSKSL